jgi:hypothetical protein
MAGRKRQSVIHLEEVYRVRVCGVGASHKGSGVLGLGWRLRVTAADAGARIICALASADADSAPRVRSFVRFVLDGSQRFA